MKTGKTPVQMPLRRQGAIAITQGSGNARGPLGRPRSPLKRRRDPHRKCKIISPGSRHHVYGVGIPRHQIIEWGACENESAAARGG